MSWFLTCFAQGADYVREMRGMVDSFRRFHPSVPVITAENPLGLSPLSWGELTGYKARWLFEVWKMWGDTGAMVWIDADARVRAPIEWEPDLPAVSAQLYPDGWATGTMVLRPGCGPLLRRWSSISRDHATDQESFAEACTSCEVEPYDLPRSVSSVCSPIHNGQPEPFSGTLWHDSAIVHWNMSRKVLGMIDDWPPTEEVRETCKGPGS